MTGKSPDRVREIVLHPPDGWHPRPYVVIERRDPRVSTTTRRNRRKVRHDIDWLADSPSGRRIRRLVASAPHCWGDDDGTHGAYYRD